MSKDFGKKINKAIEKVALQWLSAVIKSPEFNMNWRTFIWIDQWKLTWDIWTSATYCNWNRVDSLEFDSEKLHEILLKLEPIKKRVILVNELFFEEFVKKISGNIIDSYHNKIKSIWLYELHWIKVHSTDNEYRTAKAFLENWYYEVYIITRENIIILDQKFLYFITLPIYPWKKLK